MSDPKEAVRARLDFVEIVREFVPLRRGSHGFMARCPFHDEKSASFHVSPERGLFHCFGCKASGDLFAFWMRIQGVGFKDALVELAERAGVELGDAQQADPAARAERARQKDYEERLRAILETACTYYQDRLWNGTDEGAERARTLLKSRGVARPLAERYRLGYAPDGWEATGDHLRARGFSPADVEAAGLTRPSKKHEGRWTDFFRDRLVFTVSDGRGRVVGFSGRALRDGEGIPKYLSSPESALFHKGSIVFGLHEARTALSKKNEAVLVEGNFDVVAFAGAGIENVVAPLGTSFTLEQAKALRHVVEHVISAYDADRAGRAATAKLWEVTEPARLSVSVLDVSVADGKDADEWVRMRGPAEMRERVLRGTVPWVDWAALDGLQDPGLTDADLRKTAALLAVRAAALPDRLERDAALRRTALLYGVPLAELRALVCPPGTAAEPKPTPGAPAPDERPVAKAPETMPELTDTFVRAVFADATLLASPLLEPTLGRLGSDLARAWLAEARTQWLAAQRLDGSVLLALAGEDETARAYLSSVLLRTAETARERELAHKTFEETAKTIKKVTGKTDARAYRKQASLARAKADLARKSGDEEHAKVAGDEADRLMTLAREAEE